MQFLISIVVIFRHKWIRLLNKLESIYYKNKLHSNSYFHIELPTHISGIEHIQLRGSFQSLDGLRMSCITKYGGQTFNPQLVIENMVCLNRNVHIGCINRITIGQGTLIGSNVLITDHSHGEKEYELPLSYRPLYSKGPVEIGKNVWIGENICILPDVTIGDNCIIGAGSIVTRSIPENSIAVGNPARVVKQFSHA